MTNQPDSADQAQDPTGDILVDDLEPEELELLLMLRELQRRGPEFLAKGLQIFLNNVALEENNLRERLQERINELHQYAEGES